MLHDEIRRAAETAPRGRLPEVAALLWRAYGAGSLSEAEAGELSALIEARKAGPSEPKPALARRGSRPRTSESLERRRRWAASGRLPPAIAARFTLAEQAALAFVATEVDRRGDCRLAIGHLAAVAGVSETVVRNALRQARMLGLVTVEERRQPGWRNDTNVVRIASPEWSAWLKLGGDSVPGSQGHRGKRRSSLAASTMTRPTRAAGRIPPAEGGCRSARGTITDGSYPVDGEAERACCMPKRKKGLPYPISH
ncbi:transcriptional regulator [uncultured Methylobacterium sp.]|jgi:DNA-binding transcriptional ArsR family regulator|uniref:transcriptional regulator n=1 Tax=uncultured Methylobacterium sp. TaxID=157278 RepID=UPI002603EBF0|nr:transcriptional regulator [uncultured Methylobacterium sp.]